MMSSYLYIMIYSEMITKSFWVKEIDSLFRDNAVILKHHLLKVSLHSDPQVWTKFIDFIRTFKSFSLRLLLSVLEQTTALRCDITGGRSLVRAAKPVKVTQVMNKQPTK